MSINRRYIQTLAFIFVLFTGTMLSQGYDHERYWIGGGSGILARDLFWGFPISVSCNYYSQNVLISFSHCSADGKLNYIIPSEHSVPPYLKSLKETSLTCGYAQDSREILYGLSAGIGFVNGDYNERRAYGSFSVIGLALNCQCFLKLLDVIALGAIIGGNINSEESFGIITLGIYVGKFN